MTEGGWQPYAPPWYPLEGRGAMHNPLAMNGQEGHGSNTFYGEWADAVGAEELQRRIRAFHDGKVDENV
jgi:hypothetical protein